MASKIEIISANLQEDIDLEVDADIDSEELLKQAIVNRVGYLLAKEPGLLFSYMYRLDVDENQVGAIMKGVYRGDPIVALAGLIYERQMQRVETKLQFKQDPIEGWQW